jgi:hypothetical protein
MSPKPEIFPTKTRVANGHPRNHPNQEKLAILEPEPLT